MCEICVHFDVNVDVNCDVNSLSMLCEFRGEFVCK